MNWTGLAFGGLTLVLLLARPGIAADNDKERDRLLEADNLRVSAMLRQDFATLGKILGDDLIYTHSSGRVENKQQFVESLRSGQARYRALDRSDIGVRVYGASGLITGRAKVQLTSSGQDRNFDIRFINVWIKRRGAWQMVAWQSTRLVE